MEPEKPANRLTPRRAQPDRAERTPTDELVEMGRAVFRQEAAALASIADGLDESFALALRWLYGCRGRVLVTGLGKSGLVGRKIAATFTSTGTPSLFVHPVEALHGDLGIATEDDLLVAISRSGHNEELLVLQASLKALGMRSIAITGRADSPLGRRCDVELVARVDREACPLDLTPTTSSTAALAMGDALAVALLTLRDFRGEDFAIFHPSGTLGRTLRMRVEEFMHAGEEMPVVHRDEPLRRALVEIAEKRLGCTCVVDDGGQLVGFLSDGDLKRILLREDAPLDQPVKSWMIASPRTVAPDCLAREALRAMEQNPAGPITQLVVVRRGRPVGVVHLHDILRQGLSR